MKSFPARGLLPALCLIPVLLTTGCDRTQEIKDAEAVATKNPDTWVALNTFWDSTCSAQHQRTSVLPWQQTSETEECTRFSKQLLEKALRESSVPALVFLFSRDDGNLLDGWGRWRSLKEQFVTTLLTVAATSSGSSKDKDLLDAAAQVYADGTLTTKNDEAAIGLYARAWFAGRKMSANTLSQLFADRREWGSAYLWKLRCTSDCQSFVDQVQDQLTARQRDAIQALALNPSVITVNGLGDLNGVQGESK